jgi:hypothetical protein
MGRFLKKRATDYFQILFIFHVGEVPNRSDYFKSNSRSKKAPWRKKPVR